MQGGAEQRELIEKLDEAGASALAIGEKMYCPPLTDELLAASERLGLSVLSVEFPMPFVAISQAVAAANLLERCPNPSEAEIREGLAGNICRCTGYMKIFDSVRRAAEMGGRA